MYTSVYGNNYTIEYPNQKRTGQIQTIQKRKLQ